jgi:N-acyl-D-amino-acid deacylase
MIDLIIEQASVYDGTSPVPIQADVAIVGERVGLIGALADREAIRRINGRGLALAPGFIDVHSHTDELWLVDPRCEGKVAQGVTTEIGGNCGSSVAPLHGLALERRREDAAAYDLPVDWKNLGEFFDEVARKGVGLNVATLVGLGTTRRCIRGDREGKLEREELDAEVALVHETIEQGAIGVSSGLIYTPSRYADIEELSACASASVRAGAARYVSHIRSEGDALIEAVDEGLAIGRRAESAVQFSHHKAAGKKNWGKIHRTLETIDRARGRSGMDVYADVYPYTASWTELATILPDEIRAGGREPALARLADPEVATATALRLELDWRGLWHDILITDVPSSCNEELAGKRIDEIASDWGIAPARAAIRLLLEERLEPQAIFFTMNEDDVAAVLSAPFTCIGSDASARAIGGPTAHGVPHPRTFGTFPRVFGRFVRGRRTLELGEAIRRMTSLPADIFGLSERGRIAIGQYADLVLFDPEKIVDTATYERPYSYPIGIEYVWVNGQAVVSRGAPTGALPGHVLRGGRSSS